MNTSNLSLYIEILPWLIPSVVIGLFILVKYRASGFAKLAGLLSLKPLVATPLFLLILQWYQDHYTSCDPNPVYFITAVPGLGITFLLVLAFRNVAWEPVNKAVLVLLFLDTVRWGNSILMFSSCFTIGDITLVLQAYFGLAMPTIFALVSFGLCRLMLHGKTNTKLVNVKDKGAS